MFKNLFATIALSTFISFPATAQIMKAESPTRTGVNVQADAQGHLYTTPVPGGPAAPVIIQDPTTATSRANVMRPGNVPIPPAGVYAVDTIGFEYCFDGVNWEALTCTGNHGIEVNLNWQSLTAVKISKDANANAVANPVWCEITNGTAANAQATPIYAAVSKDTSVNSVTNPIWLELTNGTAANSQAAPLFSAVSKDTSINSVTNPIWLELTNGTAANAQATPLFSAVSKDTSINSVTNPIWLELTNGTAANAQATPLFSAVSKDTSINSVTNPIWLELTNGTAANAQATPLFSAVSKDTSINSVTNPIWLELTNGTAANAQATPLFSAVSKDTSANALANPIYCQLSDGTNAFMTTTSYPGYGRLQDGDSAILADVLDAFADGMATTVNGLTVASVMMLYNGATLDLARNGPNKELLIYVNNWPALFDVANNRANVYKVGSKEYNPPMEGPTAVNAVAALILTAKQIINQPNTCVWLKNVGGGGGGNFSDADVQVSPDGTNYVSLAWTTCDGLVSGSTCVYCFTAHAYNWVRVYVTGFAAASDTTASAWLTSNAN